MKIFFWTPGIDHLHFYTWNAIQSKINQKITYILTEQENKTRKKQGWKTIDLSGLDVIIMKKRGWIQRSAGIINQNREAIQVFMGFWTDRRLFPLLVYSAALGRKTVVISEQYSTSPVGYTGEENAFILKLKTVLRPFIYTAAAFLLKMATRRRNNFCVFSVSNQAMEQYIQAGFNPKTIFPFGYFVPKMTRTQPRRVQIKTIKLIFVGAMLKRKGIDIAIESLRIINKDEVKISLDLYGSGDPSIFIKDDSNIYKYVSYKGIIPSGEAQNIISQYDALLLPSRHDGWGIVVNEALLQGVPVIISENVGAKCLIKPEVSGLIFKSEDVEDLSAKLREIIASPDFLEEMKSNAQKIGQNILPDIAAQYFLDSVMFYFYKTGNRPEAIWMAGKQEPKIIAPLPIGDDT